MTDNTKLIEQARRLFRRETSLPHMLADALEAAEQRIVDMDPMTEERRAYRERLRAERDALAAERDRWEDAFNAQTVGRAKAEMERDALAAAISDAALREARAEAWAEGEASGWSRAMRYTSDEPHLGRQTNPYREGANRG